MGTEVAEVRRSLRRLADPEAAAFLRGYFRTGPGEYGEGDRFLGVRVPEVRRLVRAHRALPIEAVAELLHSRWHEERLLALLLMVEQYRRGAARERDAIFRLYLDNTRYINGWDLVDASAKHIVGPHLGPEGIDTLETLACSASVWERRIAVLATFPFIADGTFAPSLRIARLLLDDPHDLIHKAVGWMLREIGRRDRGVEEAFLREHCRTMPRTMLRYAVERFPHAARQRYMKGGDPLPVRSPPHKLPGRT